MEAALALTETEEKVRAAAQVARPNHTPLRPPPRRGRLDKADAGEKANLPSAISRRGGDLLEPMLPMGDGDLIDSRLI